MTYRPDVDGLRAVAVLSVLGFHAFPQFMPGGFVGVDIFFVISGFLISRLILEDLNNHAFSVLAFYQRRIRRILPALLVVMLFSILAGWFILFPDEYAQLAQHVAAATAFILNFSLWRESGYFDNAAETKPMLHLWSLAVEEQFYLLWPLWLAALGKKRATIPYAILGVGLLSWCCNIYLSSKSPSAAFYLPITRFWELMVGAAGAYLASIKRAPFGRHPNPQSVVGALLIAWGFLLINRNRAFPGYWALLPTGGALLIINAGEQAWVNRILLARAPLVAIGLISYPLYLWHWPLLTFLRIGTNGHPSSGLILACLLLACVLAWLSYSLLEQRIRAAKGHRHVGALIASMMLLLLISTVISVQAGLPDRAIARKLGHIGAQDVFAGSRHADGSCTELLHLPSLPEEICLTNSRSPTLLMAGDSHAMALFSSIYGKSTQADALLIAAHGCDLYPELTYAPSYQKDWGSNCTAIARRIMALTRAPNTLKTILLVNHYPPLDEGVSPYRLGNDQLSRRQAFLSGLPPLIRAARQAGKKVVFLVDVPFLKQDPKTCVQRLPFVEARDCRYTLSEHQQLRREYLQQVRHLQALYPDLIVYDPTPLFCNGQLCLDQKDGQQLYNDANHISAYASKMVLNQMRADHALDF